MKSRQCVKCGEYYEPTKNKPGFVNECSECGAESEARRNVVLHSPYSYLEGIGMVALAVTDFGDFEFGERLEIER